MQIVTTHKQTDFDGLASVIAATLLYPDSVGVVPKEVNQNVGHFLSTHKTAFNLILPNEVKFDQVQRLIVVDTDMWQRLDRMDCLRNRSGLEIHVWDHHLSDGSIKADVRHQELTGSTVTLLIREMKHRKMSLSPLVSTVMLIGLYEDTGHLTYPSTTVEDVYAAAYLLENGADLNVAGFFLNPPYEEQQKEILFELLKTTEQRTINSHTLGFNIIEVENKSSTLSRLVAMYRQIINVEAVFVIFVSDDRYSVIGRSNNEQINVGEIMRKIGGGGHPGAGSASVKTGNCTALELKNQIIELLEVGQKSGITVADLMSFPVEHLLPDTSMREAYELMRTKKIRGVLIMEDDELLGIIVLWDFKKIKASKHWEKPVKAYMARELITVAPGDTPSTAGRLMLENNIGHLPVTLDGQVIGIVTRTDILNYFYNLLPE